ncbi:MAG: tolQ: protein TolQ [Firmicutes bacterium]|nr:tolQ: protein TolQ [Bacillota bacterium]
MEFIMQGVELFSKGGLVMYPLVVCSVVVLAIIIERCMYLRTADISSAALLEDTVQKLRAGDWDEAAELCTKAKGVIAEMLARGLAERVDDRQQLEQILEGAAARMVTKLRYRLDYLDTIVTLAPLLGLLGTVTGMIASFSVLNIKSGQPLAITGGVGEALIATATGLCVAIIALVTHSYLNHRIDVIISTMEEAANSIVVAAIKGTRHEAG